MPDCDDSAHLVAAIEHALNLGESIAIFGHGSKPGTLKQGSTFLCTSDHSGILEYRPSELVITVRAGTPLSELNETLAFHGQMLASDPPMFGQRGTVGGAIATGFSGPGRPWYGTLRDSLLGVEVINGLAQSLRFGGKVIKNVAGFDISRLFAGSWGTLGVILSASFKLVPLPELTATATTECSDIDAYQLLGEYRRKYTTLTGTCHFDGRLFMRFAGAASAVRKEVQELDGAEVDDSFSWANLRDHDMQFFKDTSPLWRVSVDKGKFFENVDDCETVSEWYGNLVWIKTQTDVPPVLRGGNGYVSAFRNTERLHKPVTKYAARLRKAFDPQGILNSHIVV